MLEVVNKGTSLVKRTKLCMLGNHAIPKESHLDVVKWIIKYVTGKFGFSSWNLQDIITKLLWYSDAHWTRYNDDRKSTLGVLLFG